MSPRGSVVCLPAYFKWSVAGRRLSDIPHQQQTASFEKSFVVSRQVLGYELLHFFNFFGTFFVQGGSAARLGWKMRRVRVEVTLFGWGLEM
jgi:hypothetical protein